ncbi:hypothetical protein Mal64_13960 [Pseudobythopirellula maris]|uniref:LamG-like jellyroll fold domain-containing protein n=1 Tax=Pseudobythopirellula maris TaxID=2527991 RepID=A0A5C5ZVG6_9BACT|nr:LamG domain-containing protein [Pseudobythopirellula maris]TWT90997.1 hypothetical protein Mal64_13960 [Pseudobythopirellula maris]
MAITIHGGSHLSGGLAPGVGETPLTIACWFRPATLQTAVLLSCCNGSESDEYFSLGVQSDGVLRAAVRSGAFTPLDTTVTYPSNDWSHGAAVFESAVSRRVYLNGGAKQSQASEAAPSGVDVLGVGLLARDGTNFPFSGALAEVAIWKAALTDAEVAALGKGVSPRALTNRLDELVVYQDLVRLEGVAPLGIGLTPSGTIGGERHPAILYPHGDGMSRWSASPSIYRGEAFGVRLANAEQSSPRLAGFGSTEERLLTEVR